MGRSPGTKLHHFIYRTTCEPTGRYYLGAHSTNDLDDGYLGSGRFLRASVRKHGEAAHTREIVEMCGTRELLMTRERDVVHGDVLRDPLCMNLTIGGEGGPTRQGMTHRPESKERIRQALIGHVHSEETKAKIGAKSIGRMKGKPLSDDHKRKIADSHKGKSSPLRGIPRPPEVVEKIRALAIARQAANPRPKKSLPPPIPVELTRTKLSEASTRCWADPAFRERMKEARTRKMEELPPLTYYADSMRHLVCYPYSISNLHRMGRDLGIGRHFFHNSKGHAHYDIPKRRIAEIQARCQVVSPRVILAIIKGQWGPG